MRKILLSALIALVGLSLHAIPAKKGKITVVRDGKTVVVENHGDELHSFLTDGSGKVVEAVESPMAGKLPATRSLRRRSLRSGFSLGEHRIPVILISFDKTPFSINEPAERFSALLNEPGYSDNGATGSVRDFYVDNSGGKYTPVFDVYGPVQVSHTVSYYGHRNGDNAAAAIYEASFLLDDTIDFSKYDSDGDGEVDMLLMYYAGYSAAESGNYNDIWPHQYYMNYSEDQKIVDNRFDGVHLNRYFCTSELNGGSGKFMCGIGATCHEFAHSLGLPDFYDTDEESSGGENVALANFSLMCGGSYNNESRTPPNFNAVEREMLGWMEPAEELSDGIYTLSSISENQAYRSNSNVPGEYFVYECRDGSGWDKYIGVSGLVIYHIDRSDRIVYGDFTAAQMWNEWESYNNINNVGGHPCFDIVRSAEGDYLSFFVFPGYYGKTSVEPLDWDDNSHGLTLSNISFSEQSGKVSFRAAYSSAGRAVNGKITDYNGKPVPAAEVRLSLDRRGVRSSGPGTPPPLSTDVVATTKTDGTFTFNLPASAKDDFIITVHKNGYVPSARAVSVSRGQVSVNFGIRQVGQMMDREVVKLNGEDMDYLLPEYKMAASRFTPAELSVYGDGIISGVGYYIYADVESATSVTAVIQGAKSKKVWTKTKRKPVIGEWDIIDVSSLNIPVPSGEDYYIGYMVSGTSSTYVFLMEQGNAYGGCYSSTSTDPSSPVWNEEKGYKLWVAPYIRSEESVVPAHIGVNVISAKESYKAGEKFVFALDEAEGRTPDSVKWFYDSAAVSSESVVLLSGAHTVEALLEFADGTEELLILEINVK